MTSKVQSSIFLIVLVLGLSLFISFPAKAQISPSMSTTPVSSTTPSGTTYPSSSTEKFYQEFQAAMDKLKNDHDPQAFQDFAARYKKIWEDNRYYMVVLEGEPLSVRFKKYRETYDAVTAGNMTQAAKADLIAEHERIKEEIRKRIPYVEFGGETFVVQNTILVKEDLLTEFSQGRPYLIEGIPGVKQLVADQLLDTFLNDTVDIVGAKAVWPQDAAGNLCANSTKDCLTGKGIKVAVIDTGVDYTHPDFADEKGICTPERFAARDCKKIVDGYDFGNKDSDPMDADAHGTHVAGIIAANGVVKGIAPDAQIYAYKVAADIKNPEDILGGKISLQFFSNVLRALEKASDFDGDGNLLEDNDHVDIVNLSSGSYSSPDDFMAEALGNVMDLGIVVVVAIGNAGYGRTFTTASPGNEENVIGVGASCKPSQVGTLKDRYGNQGCDNGIFNGTPAPLASFSSKGPTSLGTIKPDIVAPGHYICSTKITDTSGAHLGGYPDCADDHQHIALSGTSMASPVVAGAVALLKQKHPDWNPYQIKYTLKGTAQDFGLARMYQGAGQINIKEAIELKTNNSFPRANLYALDDLFVKGVVEIKGIATDYDYQETDFASYSLLYAEGFDDGQQQMNWKEVTPSTTTPVSEKGILGKIDTSQIANYVFTLRLVVKDKAGQESVDEMVLFKKPDSWVEGWPHRVLSDTTFKQIGPVFGDVTGDGKNEIIVGIQTVSDAKIYVFDIGGKLLWSKTLPRGVGATPTLGYIDDDHVLDIVYTGIPFLGTKKYIYAWKGTGEDISPWPMEFELGSASGSWDSLTVSDIDNDGKDEILVVPPLLHLFIFRGDGSKLIGGWEEFPSPGFPNFSAIDTNNDGKKEVFHYEGSYVNKLYGWDNNGKNILNLELEQFADGEGFLTYANVDEDPQIEIILYYNYTVEVTPSRYVNHARIIIIDGKLFSIQNDIDLETTVISELIAANIDQDPQAEIIFSNKLAVGGINFDGSKVFPPIKLNPPYSFLNLVVSNVDSSSEAEIIIQGRSEVRYIKNGLVFDLIKGDFNDYSELRHISFSFPGLPEVTVADIIIDGKNEFLSTLYPGAVLIGNLGTTFSFDSYVILGKLEATSNNQWPMFGHDVRHSFSLPSGLFIRGDANGDWKVDISDAVSILQFLFINGRPPEMTAAADVNDDGKIDISDPIYLLGYLFLGKTAPPAPFPTAGYDFTP